MRNPSRIIHPIRRRLKLGLFLAMLASCQTETKAEDVSGEWYYDNHTNAPKGSQPLRDGDDPCYPALWREKTLVAYSAMGYELKIWRFPPAWEGMKCVTVSEMKPDELKQLNLLEVKDGAITWSLTKQQGVIIESLEKTKK